MTTPAPSEQTTSRWWWRRRSGVVSDDSRMPCPDCENKFDHAMTMPRGATIDYVWKCPQCRTRWRVGGTRGALRAKAVIWRSQQ